MHVYDQNKKGHTNRRNNHSKSSSHLKQLPELALQRGNRISKRVTQAAQKLVRVTLLVIESMSTTQRK